MGESACWLDRVCDGCGRVDDDLDDDRLCAACAGSTGPSSSSDRSVAGDGHQRLTGGSSSTRS